VVDPESRVIGTGGRAVVRELDQQVRRQVDAAWTAARTVRATDVAGRPCWIAPVLAGTERLGALVLWPAQEPAGADLRTLERAGQVTALLLLNQRTVAEAELRVRGELLTDLLRGSADDESVRQRGLLLGTELGEPHCVVVAVAPGHGEHRTASAASAVARELGGLAGTHHGQMVLLLPGEDPEESVRVASRRLTASLEDEVTAGAAGPTRSPGEVPNAYVDAARCVQVLHALGREGSSATSGDLGAYALLLAGLGAEALEDFIGRTVGPLLAYDEERGTDLRRTLEAYFANSGNLARTSEALHIHVNTLYQRLDRVGQLLGVDWQHPERSLHTHLALRLDRLRTTL
jgi:sugar diacid utilization regulator